MNDFQKIVCMDLPLYVIYYFDLYFPLDLVQLNKAICETVFLYNPSVLWLLPMCN